MSTRTSTPKSSKTGSVPPANSKFDRKQRDRKIVQARRSKPKNSKPNLSKPAVKATKIAKPKIKHIAVSVDRSRSPNAKPGRKIKSTVPKSVPKPNARDMLKFIKRVHGPAASAVYQQYSKEPSLKADSATISSKPNRALHDRLVKANATGMNVALMINSSSTGKRNGEDVDRITAIFVDSDDQKLSKAKLLAAPISPHIIVESSPGRFHAYWFVKDCAVGQFSLIQKAMAARFGTDRSICDLGRVMRLPGTLNWKRSPPFLSRIVHFDEADAIAIARLIKEFELELNQQVGESGATVVPDLDGAIATIGPAQAVSVAQVRVALTGLSADERMLWRQVGTGIHSLFPNEIGFGLWTDWSMTSEKFNAEDQRSTWDRFMPGKGINIASVFWLANRARGRNLALDDFDIAHLFAATFGDRARFDPTKGNWYAFGGVIWHLDKQAPARMALDLINDLSAGDGRLDAAIKRYRTSAGPRTIVHSAELLKELHINEKSFDADPKLLALNNGVVNLVTGEFQAAQPSDYLSRCADVDYVHDAKCPQWITFIKQITCGDLELAKYLRRAVGYTVFGHANEQVVFIGEGKGGNGKGVFMRVIKSILGGYAAAPSPHLLTTAYAGNVNSSSPALAALQGQRMCIITEMPNNKSFDAAFVKQYAGGDEITARANYGDLVTFKPQGKLWVSTNDMPEIAANDDAMWRRLVTIPFNATFKGKDRDNDLEDKLWKERSGILNWILRGAKDYYGDTLGSCTAVDEHRSKLRSQSDTLGAWVSECCRRRKDAEMPAALGYASYVEFAKAVGRRPITLKVFRDRLEDLGFHHRRKSSFNCYVGLEIKPPKA